MTAATRQSVLVSAHSERNQSLPSAVGIMQESKRSMRVQVKNRPARPVGGGGYLNENEKHADGSSRWGLHIKCDDNDIGNKREVNKQACASREIEWWLIVIRKSR
jgi:hypothetical protein